MRKILTVLFLLSFLAFASHAQDAVPGDVIIVLRNTTGVRINSAKTAGGVKSLSSVQSFAASQNVKVVETFDSLSDRSNNIFMVVHSDNEDENALLRRIKSRPDVIAASLNRIYTLNLPTVPDDSEYFRLWGMDAINAPDAWTYGTGSDDVYVAVVDSGIDYNHPDLRDNFSHEYSRNFLGHAGTDYDPSAYYDERGHGTHVAGTIAGVGNNAQGVAGVNWKAKLFSVRVLNKNGSGTDADIIAAFNYISGLLTKEPRLNLAAVNFSVGGYITDSPEKLIADNNPLWLALKMLSDTGRTLICAAAGNDTNDIGRPTPSTTSSWLKGSYALIGSYLELDNMIVVAATNRSLSRAYFSNYSRKYVDIAAPGVSIFSTIPLTLSNDTGYAVLPRVYPYASNSGTSMATPHVAGSAALLKAIYPKATASQIKAALLGGANADYLRDDGTSAHGLLDLTGAINFMAGIMSADTSPQISDANPPEGVVNQRYKTDFYASGTQPVTVTIDGALPEGLTFDGVKISGTPKESGSFPFTVTASNSYGSSSLALTLVISPQSAPVLLRSDDMTPAYVSSDYRADIYTSAGDWPMKWRLASGDYPADFGARINEDSGILSFTPTKAGTYSFPVTVSNDSGSDSYTFKITVNEAKAAEISETNKHNITLGRPVSVKYVSENSAIDEADISVIAYGTKPLSWNVQNLPKGVGFGIANNSLAPTMQTLTLTGRAEESGDFHVIVTVSNDWGASSTDLLITVEDSAPIFISNALYTLKSLEKDTEFSFNVPVYGSAPMTFTISGDLPAGTRIRCEDCTPIFYGKPTKNGHYVFTITAENSAGKDERTIDFYVREPSEIITHFLPDAVKGVSYDAKINLRSNASMKWTLLLADESLNMKISQTGNITAFPTLAGEFIVVVQTESPDVSADSSVAYRLTVKAAPAIKTSSLPDCKINTAYPLTPLSADGTAPVMWTVSEGVLPKGLTLSRNGYIFGTPEEGGLFIFTLRAENTAGHDTKTLTVNITGGSGSDTPETPTSRDVDPEPSSGDIPPAPISPDIPPTPKEVKITVSGARDISSLTIGELASITAADGVIAAVLPEIRTNDSAFYTPESVDCFANVKISDDVPTGWRLVWNAFTRGKANALSMEDAEDDNVQFTDSDGNIIITVPEDHTVNVSAWLDADTLYAPVISATEHKEDPEGLASSGSGGCLNLSGASLLAAFIPLIALGRRKR